MRISPQFHITLKTFHGPPYWHFEVLPAISVSSSYPLVGIGIRLSWLFWTLLIETKRKSEKKELEELVSQIDSQA